MTNLIIILNIFLLETLLSIDNAAVLAIMVKDLPHKKQLKALRYGLLGAFVFRGLCLFLAAWLIQIQFLKIIGGGYLIWLAINHFSKSPDHQSTPPPTSKKLWEVIIMIEIIDLAFSIDNIFAAVALTNNFTLIMIGICAGIMAMRFVAGAFTRFILKYPKIINGVFIIICLLGIKLMLAGCFFYLHCEIFITVLNSHTCDIAFSAMMIAILLYLFFTGKKIAE